MAGPDRSTVRRRRETLRTCHPAQLARWFDPFDPTLAGVLYEAQAPEPPPEERAALERDRPRTSAPLLRAAGQRIVISGGPLSSSEPAPFVLDGRTYASVWSFCQALKLAEHDPRRPAIAAGQRGRVKPTHRGWFEYADEQVVVNSPMHGELVIRATFAKVHAHRAVQDALAATGSRQLVVGDPGSGALGRYMPLALMVLRLKLFGR